MPLRNSPLLYALLYPTWQVMVLAPLLGLLARQELDRTREHIEWAAWVFTLLLLSPVPASYHFVVMSFSMVLLADSLLLLRHYRTAALALALYSMVSLVEFLPHSITASPHIALGFTRLWVEMGFWLVLLSCLWRNRETPARAPGLRPRAVLLCVLAGFLWTVGVLGYQRHFSQLSEEMMRRLPDAPAAYLSTGLRNCADGYVFTAMRGEGYQVLDQAGRRIGRETGKQMPDELAVAATESALNVVVEVADSRGSRLMVLPMNSDRSPGTPQARLLIEDGESPAVSSDGRTVVFIRESKGRGSLWLVSLAAPFGWPQAASVQLTSDAYDVRSFAVAPSGWIVFAARVAAHTALFQFVPGGTPNRFLPAVENVDAPAISPDERLVAFTRRVHSRWQLEYVNRTMGLRQTLTTGDCNAYSPQWIGPLRLTYASDCGRGLGLTALASVQLAPVAATGGVRDALH